MELEERTGMAPADVVVDEHVTAKLPREWWQVWAERRARWWAGRPVLARRCARVRAVGLWVALAWLLALVVFVPDLTLGLRAYLGCVWTVIAWFALVRTKTLTWSGLMRFFAVCVPWSVLIGVVCTVMADASMAGEPAAAAIGGVDAAGPKVAIAGIAEEALKLAPVAVLAVLAPRRAARFASVDWVLLGVASGTAFLAVEETLRRVAWQTGVGRGWFDFGPDDEVPEGWILFRLFPVPSDWDDGVAGFGGHAVMTPIVTGLVGLGVAWWRATRNPGWRLLAVVLPVVALWSAIADHAGYNVQNAFGAFGGGLSSLLSEDPEAVWLDPAETSVPWWLRAPWSWLGHGHGRAGVFLIIVAVCLLVDARRLAAVPSSGLLADRQPPRWPRKTVVQVATWTRSWPRPLAAVARSVASAVTALVWVVLRDLGDAVMAFSRQRGESRRRAAARGMTAVSGQRATRELALEALAGPVHVRRRRLLALAAVLLLAWLGFVLAPQTASVIGVSASDWPAWLAGVADILAEWWAEQPLAVQLAIGAGVAGLVVLSGGSLGVALGVSGALTWGLDKGHGIATFVRDPNQATRDYIATATPGQVIADTAGVALTFAPGNFIGARVGQGGRAVADDIAADPAAWMATRRAMLREEPERGSVPLEWFLARKPIPLADGTTRPALSAAEEAAAAARYETYPSTPVKGAPGPARDGQIEVYGENERIVHVPSEDINVHPDGFTPQYGAIGDYKHVTSARSWYIPEGIENAKMRELATRKIDSTLNRLQSAADEVMGSGDGVVEITTNSEAAAEFIESRMRELAIRGYVRLTN
ncbi:restriction endonuclease fold toxin-2 domain-containing protein [Isoptericola sp. NPDC019482]|uniref:restriction endonuclease fold toxin-2 domain-containing protein n=1 Tax=Isoptericola sp. NPDC019482 TaxID=3154688 RepID=UPI0034699400